MAFLEIENLCKTYGAGRTATRVLQNINLRIDEGEFVAIVGFSGSGKTTLISFLAGLIRPDSGRLSFKGRAIDGPGPERGVVFQNYSLMPWLTVHGNIALAVDEVFKHWPKTQRRRHTQKYIDMVGLSHASDRRPAELSGGMRQRVAVARALAMQPELLLLDEPLSALDALTRAKLQQEIEFISQREKKTIVLITNDVDEAILLADRIIPLNPGPAACLGPEFRVDIPRPRDRTAMNHNDAFKQLRRDITRYLMKVGLEAASGGEDPPLPAVKPNTAAGFSANKHFGNESFPNPGSPNESSPNESSHDESSHDESFPDESFPNRSAEKAARPQTQALHRYLEFSGLSKVYPTPKGPLTVVDNFDLKVKKGEFVSLIGHSGCGKSTVLSMVAGLNEISGGGIILDGREVTTAGPDRGVVFQAPSLFPWLSAYENVALGVERVYPHASKKERRQIIEYYLCRVGLAGAMDKKAAELSNGMKQRVGIARAFALSPKLLLLDEPFGMLDSLTRWELQEVLMEVWRRTRVTAVCVTHDVDEAILLADRVVMMTNGPRARVGKILEVNLPRPRTRKQLLEHPDYYRLRETLLTFLEECDRTHTNQPGPERLTDPAQHRGEKTPLESPGGGDRDVMTAAISTEGIGPPTNEHEHGSAGEGDAIPTDGRDMRADDTGAIDETEPAKQRLSA